MINLLRTQLQTAILCNKLIQQMLLFYKPSDADNCAAVY